MLKHSGLFFISLLIVLNACNDQPASPIDEIDPPELPSFEGLPYDFGVFDELEASSNEVATPEHDEVEDIEALLTDVLELLKYRVDESVLAALNNAFSPSHDITGSFDNGGFVWEYDLESDFYSGVEINHPALLRGEHVEDETVFWDLTLYGDGTGNGEFRLIEGQNTVLEDEQKWTIYNLDEAPDVQKSVSLNWTYNEDDQLDLIDLITRFDEENGEPVNYTMFELEEDEMFIRFRRAIASQTIQYIDAVMDADDGDGKMTYRLGAEDDQSEYCWESDFEIVECE